MKRAPSNTEDKSTIIMFKLDAFGVLFVAAFMAQHASECCGRDPGASEPLDPVIELNNYLEHTVAQLDFDKNIEALERLQSQADQLNDKPKVKDLLELILRLRKMDDGDFCDEHNLKSLAAVSEIAFGPGSNALIELRLKTLLANYIDRAWEQCLDSLESQFDGAAEWLSANYKPLEKLRPLFWDLGEKRAVGSLDSLTYLLGAIENKRFKEPPTSGFFKIRLRALLDDLFCSEQSAPVEPVPCALKIDELTGENDKLTLDEADEQFDKYFFAPCLSFVNNATVKSVLGRVADLSGAVLNKNPSQELTGNHYRTLEWAPVNLVCQWFFHLGKAMIVEQLTGRSHFGQSGILQKFEAAYSVNKYLVDTLPNNWNMNDNIRALRDLRAAKDETVDKHKELKFVVPATAKLIKFVSKLRPFGDEDFCGEENLRNLRASTDIVVGQWKGSFRFPLNRRRFNHLLIRYTREALVKCLYDLESDFSRNAQSLPEEYKLLEKLDSVCLIRAKKLKSYYVERSSDFGRLIGANNLPKQVWTAWNWSFETKLRHLLESMQQDGESDAKAGKRKTPTLEGARSYLEEQFFDECSSFVGEESPVKSILERISDLSVAIDNIDAGSELNREGNHSLSFQWASRLVACQWFHDKGLDTFAKLLAKKTAWRAIKKSIAKASKS